MEIKSRTPQQLAIDRAIEVADGKTALMRLLNERGHNIGSHNTISQWQENGTPAKYCPDRASDVPTRARSAACNSEPQPAVA